jgi:serine/threonine-protein kinase
MAIVHAVRDYPIGRRAALKILKNAGSPDDAARFVEVARIMAQLDHPNVVPVYDLWLEPGQCPGLLMKLVEGSTLTSLVHETAAAPVPSARLEELLHVVLKVCDAVSFAHSHGLVHRDLHPGNVLVGSHRQVYVMDWGLAVRRDRASTLGSVGWAFGSGTPAYMAPEQAKGRDDEIDERTDVFGLGGILYEFLTLRPPYLAAALPDVIAQAQRGLVVRPKAVVSAALPARLCAIAMRALSASREDRHPNVQALRDDIDAFIRGGGWFAMQQFARGALMLREGEVGDVAYLVTEGECKVFRGADEGLEVLRKIGPEA